MSDGALASSAEALRRRRDAIFGDVLPDVSKDERDDGHPDVGGAGGVSGGGDEGHNSAEVERESELLNDVPPHHG